MTKFGFNQVNRPAPLLYRRIANSLTIAFVPLMISVVQGWGISDQAQHRWLTILGVVPAALQGIGILLGDGQVYKPTNEQVDTKNEEKNK